MMLHLPFFKAMSELADDDPAWHVLGAGYLVIRAFEDWLKIGSQRLAFDLDLSNVYTTIGILPDEYQPERLVLQEVLNVLSLAPGPDIGPAVGPLIAYGTMLENRGIWGVAADVYHTITQGVERFDPDPDLLSLAITRLREGLCWRHANEYEHAGAAYDAVAKLALATNNDVLRLQARLGIANIARARGDLPGAEAAMNAILDDAGRCRPHVIELLRWTILQGRGSVRQARGHYVEAIVDLYDAYRDTPDSLERELILVDLGVCASDAGYRKIARDALEIIVLTARRALARQSAIVNLLEIAVLDGNQIAFEQWRAKLIPTQSSPLMNAYAKLYLARGIERFQDRERALPAFHEAARYAEQVGIHQAQFEALRDIERLEQAATAPRKVAVPVPQRLAYIAEALADLRIFVGLEG